MRRVTGPSLERIESSISHSDRIVTQAVHDVLKAVVGHLGRTTVRAGIVAAGGTSLARAADPDDLSGIQMAWTEQVNGHVGEYVIEMYNDSAELMFDEIGDVFPEIRHDIAILPEVTYESVLADARNRLVGLGNHIWDVARTELTIGLNQNESMDQLRDRIMKSTSIAAPRAMTIARTEVIAAMNEASLRQIQYAGMRGKKEWLATSDDRTRPSHRIAGGQTVPLGGSFTVGGSMLEFPGDPRGAAGEIINCRCSMGFELDPPLALTASMQSFCKAPKHPGPCKGWKGTKVTSSSSGSSSSSSSSSHGGGGGGGGGGGSSSGGGHATTTTSAPKKKKTTWDTIVKKAAAKKAAPTSSAPTKHATPSHATQTQHATTTHASHGGSIDHISAEQRAQIYQQFKTYTPKGMSPCWPASKIYEAVQHVKSQHPGLTDMQALKVLDDQHKLAGKKGENPYTTKTVQWLKTPKGVKAALAAQSTSAPAHHTTSTPAPAKTSHAPAKTTRTAARKRTTATTSTSTSQRTADSTLIPAGEFSEMSPADAQAMQARAKSWTVAQHKALTRYSGQAYIAMNRFLRTGDYTDSTIPNACNYASAGMRPIDRNIVVHRGCNFKGLGVNNAAELRGLIGKTVHERGFTSTSVGDHPAFNYTDVRLKIQAPKGTHAAYIDKISLNRGEHELLLAPGMRMRILGVTERMNKHKTRTYYEVETQIVPASTGA